MSNLLTVFYYILVHNIFIEDLIISYFIEFELLFVGIQLNSHVAIEFHEQNLGYNSSKNRNTFAMFVHKKHMQ